MAVIVGNTLKDRVTKVVLDETLTKEERSKALFNLVLEHRATTLELDEEELANDWNNMVADIVTEHNLRRH